MNKSGERIGIIGIVINILIAIPKIVLGILGNSISLFTDGINNACDSITGVVTYVGIRISKKPMDSDHPYGHGRAEYVAGFLVSLFTAVVGVQFFISSFKNLLDPQTPDLDTMARLFLVLSIGLKIFFAHINNKEYKKHGSTIFKANREDSLMDTVISIFILISSYFFQGNEWLDSGLGILISILILYHAWETLKFTITPLIGPSPSNKDIETIENAMEESKMITNVHNIYVDRYSMEQAVATVDVEVDPGLTVAQVHEEIEILTNRLRQEEQIDLVVHVEPMIQDTKLLHIKRLLKSIKGVVGVHDLIMKEENYVTLSIDQDMLDKKEGIIREALEILRKKDDKKWNVDAIVSFKTKRPS